MNETSKNAIECENDVDNTNSKSAFHQHVWWVAIVIFVAFVLIIIRALGAL